MTDPTQPPTEEQRRLFRRMWLGFGLLFLLLLVAPHWLFRAGHRNAALYTGGLGLLAWFLVVGWSSDKARKKLADDQDTDGCLSAFLLGCLLLGSLLFLLVRFVAANR